MHVERTQWGKGGGRLGRKGRKKVREEEGEEGGGRMRSRAGALMGGGEW